MDEARQQLRDVAVMLAAEERVTQLSPTYDDQAEQDRQKGTKTQIDQQISDLREQNSDAGRQNARIGRIQPFVCRSVLLM